MRGLSRGRARGAGPGARVQVASRSGPQAGCGALGYLRWHAVCAVSAPPSPASAAAQPVASTSSNGAAAAQPGARLQAINAACAKLAAAGMAGTAQDLASFTATARTGANIVPIVHRLFSDQLTPVSAYR